jgi:hypothetical protein
MFEVAACSSRSDMKVSNEKKNLAKAQTYYSKKHPG